MRFASGPTIAVAYPFVIEVEFLRDAKGDAIGVRWRENGKDVVARKITPHREDVSVHNGDIVLKGTLLLPATPDPHPAAVFAHGSGDATRDVAIWNPYFALAIPVLRVGEAASAVTSVPRHTPCWRSSIRHRP